MMDVLPMDRAEIVEVIKVTKFAGCGKPGRDCSRRLVTEYYQRDGHLLVQFDPVGDADADEETRDDRVEVTVVQLRKRTLPERKAFLDGARFAIANGVKLDALHFAQEIADEELRRTAEGDGIG